MLPVAHPDRLVIGRAVLGSLATALVFLAFAWTTKEVPALYGHAPWQNDPFDTAVSFALFFIPSLVGLCMLRVPLCRRDEQLAVRRAADLLRASRVLAGVMLATLLGDWASVAAGADRGTWNGTTTVLIGLLAVVTVLVGTLCRRLWLAGRVDPMLGRTAAGPDWLADAVTLGARGAAGLGLLGGRALGVVRWLDTRILTRVRRHPLRTAAALSVFLGTGLAGSQLAEGAPTPVILLFFAVSACGLFAFLAIAGSYLRVVGTGGTPTPLVSAFVLASASVPLALAFRSDLWWVLGTREAKAGLPQLALLVLVVAAATGCVTYTLAPLLKRSGRWVR